VTYLKVKNQLQYLSAVLDLHSRRIIGLSLDVKRTTDVTKCTLASAIRMRKLSKGLMVYTDRGVEYRGAEYQKELRRYGILHSLSRPGKCTDNAHMESFFHSLKGELIRVTSFKSGDELKYVLAHYINDFYNHKRLHSGIGYYSSIGYERMAV
jgi:putative transposase